MSERLGFMKLSKLKNIPDMKKTFTLSKLKTAIRNKSNWDQIPSTSMTETRFQYLTRKPRSDVSSTQRVGVAR